MKFVTAQLSTGSGHVMFFGSLPSERLHCAAQIKIWPHIELQRSAVAPLVF